MAFHAADQIHGDEAQHATFRRLHNEMPKPGQRHATRPTLIDQRGNTGAHADHIRVQAKSAGDMLVNMGVRIDHSGGDNLTRDIQDFVRRLAGDRGFDRRDDAIPNADIGNAVASGCRIDHPAAA